MDTPFPLGRVEDPVHDPRSLGFAAPAGLSVVPKKWRRYGNVLDQGSLGSCTGNAGVGCLNHEPFHVIGSATYKEPDAVNLYSAATFIDPYDGAYPPIDTGSDGLSVAKVLKSQGKITGYLHAFDLDHVLSALMVGPLIIGTRWHESMFYPDSRARVEVSGDVKGGHEYVLDGVYTASPRMLRFQNSWGSTWGDYGKFYMRWDDFAQLLDDNGDAVLFRR